jgi:hypothetical protein
MCVSLKYLGKPGGLGLNLRIIVSKTRLVFMGHMLRLNLTSTPPSISLLKSESVQEDLEDVVCVGHLRLQESREIEGIEGQLEELEDRVRVHPALLQHKV